jgi:hypothetical protein
MTVGILFFYFFHIIIFNDMKLPSEGRMTIEQTVTIPSDYRIFLELPRSVPSGVMARVKIDIPAVSEKDISASALHHPSEIEEVRQLLQKEMADNGTLAVIATSGDGWEAHVRERYAES